MYNETCKGGLISESFPQKICQISILNFSTIIIANILPNGTKLRIWHTFFRKVKNCRRLIVTLQSEMAINLRQFFTLAPISKKKRCQITVLKIVKLSAKIWIIYLISKNYFNRSLLWLMVSQEKTLRGLYSFCGDQSGDISSKKTP